MLMVLPSWRFPTSSQPDVESPAATGPPTPTPHLAMPLSLWPTPPPTLSPKLPGPLPPSPLPPPPSSRPSPPGPSVLPLPAPPLAPPLSPSPTLPSISLPSAPPPPVFPPVAPPSRAPSLLARASIDTTALLRVAELLVVFAVALCACAGLWVQTSRLPAHLSAFGLPHDVVVAANEGTLVRAAERLSRSLLPPARSPAGGLQSRAIVPSKPGCGGGRERGNALDMATLQGKPLRERMAILGLLDESPGSGVSSPQRATAQSSRWDPSSLSSYGAGAGGSAAILGMARPSRAVVRGASSSSLERRQEYFLGMTQPPLSCTRGGAPSIDRVEDDDDDEEEDYLIDLSPNEMIDYRAAQHIRRGAPPSHGCAPVVPTGPTCTPTHRLPPPTLLPPPSYESLRTQYAAPAHARMPRATLPSNWFVSGALSRFGHGLNHAAPSAAKEREARCAQL